MIVCTKCGSIDSYRVEQKSHNNCAYCKDCGAFIKNIPYEKPRFYIGKYKGQQIDQITDRSYLVWAAENMRNISNQTRNAITERIKMLSH